MRSVDIQVSFDLCLSVVVYILSRWACLSSELAKLTTEFFLLSLQDYCVLILVNFFESS